MRDVQRFLFDDNILVDLNGIEKKNKKNVLNDFYTKTLIHRRDGGVVLVAELQREFTRRNAGISNFDRSMAASRVMLIITVKISFSFLFRQMAICFGERSCLKTI